MYNLQLWNINTIVREKKFELILFIYLSYFMAETSFHTKLCMFLSIKEELSLEKLQGVKLWITAGPREKFTAAEVRIWGTRTDEFRLMPPEASLWNCCMFAVCFSWRFLSSIWTVAELFWWCSEKEEKWNMTLISTSSWKSLALW